MSDFPAGGDTGRYMAEVERFAETFFSYPEYYFRSMLGLPVAMPEAAVFDYPDRAEFFKNSGTYVFIHLHAILRLVSGGYYPIHVLYTCLAAIWGTLQLYRALFGAQRISPCVFIGLFLLPSVVFWTSGVHKDAFVLAGVGATVSGFAERKTGMLLLGLVIILLMRSYLLAALLPALLGGLWLRHNNSFPVWKMGGVYAVLVIAVFAIDHLLFSGYLLAQVQQRHLEFEALLPAEAAAPKNPLRHHWLAWLAQIPLAMLKALTRPWWWECSTTLQWASAAELSGITIGLVGLVLKLKKARWVLQPTAYMLLAYALTNAVIVGLIVDNTGAIVRYRSIALLCLVAVFLSGLLSKPIEVTSRERLD